MLADVALSATGGWGLVLLILLVVFLILGIVWFIRHF